MARYKSTSHKTTLSGALADAYSALQELAEEVREVVDNASGTNFENTQRIQTLDETASTLEGINEVTVEGVIGDFEVEYAQSVSSRRRGLSRRARCDNALDIYDTCIQVLQEKSDEWSEGEHGSEENPYEDLISEIENVKGEAEGCEFPGMFG
jgi:hypothetical protein